MIEKIRKLNLAALLYDRDGILNVLHRTHAAEIKEHAQIGGTSPLPGGGEELQAYLNGLESALEILVAAAEDNAREDKDAARPQKDGFCVTYSEFYKAAALKESAEETVNKINAITDEKNGYAAEHARLLRAVAAAEPYANLRLPFGSYSATLHTNTRLGLISAGTWDNLKRVLNENPLVAYAEEMADAGALVAVTCHKSVDAQVQSLLSEGGFAPCAFKGEVSGSAQLARLFEELERTAAAEEDAKKRLLALTPQIRNLKLYCDYVGFLLEKAQTAGKLRATGRTFFLEAFVPAADEERVKSALDGSGFAVWYEFSDPAESEELPTLMKNNRVIANFETITNMYSPPNAREIDPNTVMAFFYSLFLGFIMADIGYGLMMLIGGGIIYFKTKKGGLKNLAGVFAVGGVFTVFWGIMFNSLLGIPVLPFTVMPDAQTKMYSLAGISLPAVLIISLLMGVVQLMAGYLCKAAQCWHKGEFWDGVFTGVVWAVFSLGVGMAMVGLVEDFNLPFLVNAGGIVALASLIVAMLTAGRKQKPVGKIVKAFGSLYGLIGYFTDVLSYLRLYGLMLTGAVIAQVVSQYGVSFLTSGTLLAALGVVLMIVGHVFNLAISLLGAYIHTARLQYVEFFGKFYVGDGELFAPLGSKNRHVDLE